MTVMLGKGDTISTSMNAKIIGTGEQVLVLAHGYGGDQTIWDNIVPSLAPNYKILLFDWNFSDAAVHKGQNPFDEAAKYRGSFEAYAEDLMHLMDETELKYSSSSSCVFIGHSMSAMIGCIASIKRPQLFNKLILIGASPRYLNSDGYEGGFETSDIDEILSSIGSNFQGWAEAFAPVAVGGKDMAAVEKFKTSLTRMKPEIALALAKIIFLGDHRDVLEHVSTPCIVIQTSNDAVVPNSVPYYMQKKMMKGISKVVIMDNCEGHFPMLTDHNQLLDVLHKALVS